MYPELSNLLKYHVNQSMTTTCHIFKCMLSCSFYFLDISGSTMVLYMKKVVHNLNDWLVTKIMLGYSWTNQKGGCCLSFCGICKSIVMVSSSHFAWGKVVAKRGHGFWMFGSDPVVFTVKRFGCIQKCLQFATKKVKVWWQSKEYSSKVGQSLPIVEVWNLSGGVSCNFSDSM